MCYCSPVRTVRPNHEVVVFQPRIVTAPDLGSVSNIINILSLPPACSNHIMDLIPLPPPLYLSPISTPPFTRRCRLYLSMHPLLPPPPLSRAQRDLSPGRHPHPPASAAPMCFPPMPVGPRSPSCEPVTTFPCLVVPPFTSSICAKVPVSLRGSPVRGCLPYSACLHHPHTGPFPCHP